MPFKFKQNINIFAHLKSMKLLSGSLTFSIQKLLGQKETHRDVP